MALVDQLDGWDREVFLAVNGLHAPWMDSLMLGVSDMLLWFPLYAFFLYRGDKFRGLGGRMLPVTVEPYDDIVSVFKKIGESGEDRPADSHVEGQIEIYDAFRG